MIVNSGNRSRIAVSTSAVIGLRSSTSIANGGCASGASISPARSRSTARVAAAWMSRCARTGGMITAASRDSARFTTAVSIPGHTFSMIPATTSSPAMSAVGTPRWVAASANISPSDSARPSSRTSLYAP